MRAPMPFLGGLLQQPQSYGYTPVALGPFDRTGMSPQALAFADAFSAATGDRVLGVNSAHRDAQHNADVGGARGSQHIQGNALDIDVSGLSEQERIALIQTARSLGAGGVGVYNNSLHFDVGPTRAWGPDYHAGSIPSWAAEAVGVPRDNTVLAASSGTNTMTGGAGGDTMATGLLAPQEPAGPPSIWDRLAGVPILGGLANPDRRARLAVGLSGMSVNPNEMLMASNMQGIQQRQQERETTQRMNQTIAYLQSVGRDDLIALVQAGMDPGAALQESARQPETVQPIEINGQLVDPVTGAVIGDYRTPEAVAPGFTVMTPEEVTALGLPSGTVWQRGPNGEIKQVDGSGTGTSYIATGAAAESLGLDPQFSYNIESGPEGMRATRIGGDGTSVTVNTGETGAQIGTIPQGFAWVPDPSIPAGGRLERIPGGPEDVTASTAAAAVQDAQQADIVLGTIGSIRETLDKEGWFNLPEVGIIGSKLAEFGLNQQAVNVAEQLKTLQGSVAFDALNAMRAASPTGGALGAVSDTEMGLLQSTLGTLSNRVDAATLRESLDTIERIMAKFAAYPGNGDMISDADLLQKYGGSN